MFRFPRTLPAIFALVLSCALPAMTLAKTGFAVTADRTSVTEKTATRIALTFTPDVQDMDNRCYAVHIPRAFAIGGVQIIARPDGSNWSAFVQGDQVRLSAQGGDSRIQNPDRLSVSIIVTATKPGTHEWKLNSHDNDGCGGRPDDRVALAVMVASASPTPAPPPKGSKPSPAPKPPKPSPAPKPPKPTPAPRGPSAPPAAHIQSPAPSASSQATASPSGSTDTSTPTGQPVGAMPDRNSQPPSSRKSEAEPGPDAPPMISAPGRGGSSSAAPGPGPSAPSGQGTAGLIVSATDSGARGPLLEAELTSTALSAMAIMDNTFEWFVPGLTVGVPGMLILGVLSAQVAGGLAWLPAVRRTLREDRRRRRPLRPGWL